MKLVADAAMIDVPFRARVGATARTWSGASPEERRFPIDAQAKAGAEGAAGIVVEKDAAGTRIAELGQYQPLRVLVPRAAEGDPLTLVLVNTSGGVVGGDRLRCELTARAGSSCLLIAQSAEKIYRSAGPRAEIEYRLNAHDDAWVEFLPQGTILFESARLGRVTRLDLRGTARVLAGEILVLGRIASGERVARCSLRDRWEVHRDGRLVWCDALRLEGGIESQIKARAGFNGARTLAICIYAGPGAGSLIEEARAMQEAENAGTQVRCGVTSVGGMLILRWLGEDAQGVRSAFGRFWAGWRAAVASLPPRLPRIWAI